MRKDLELVQFKLEARWNQLIPQETCIDRDPSGAIALRTSRVGLQQILDNECELVRLAGCEVVVFCPSDAERLCLRFTRG